MLVPNYPLALQLMHKVLQPGGLIAVTVWKGHGHWDYLGRAARIILNDDSYAAPTFFSPKWFDKKFLRTAVKAAGFR